MEQPKLSEGRERFGPTGMRTSRVFGALALELASGSDPASLAVSQQDAGALATLLAADLAGFEPAAAELQLAVCGAHFDTVELLRPGWPLHAALARLAAAAPGAGSASGRVIAFGMHDGRMPDALTPSPEHVGGPLRLLPFVLQGDDQQVRAVGDRFERDLLERGMAGASTALAAQDAFGLHVEHARYLTLHDLLAMTALQYEHAGLAPLWPVIEAALLAPGSEEWLDTPPEPPLHFANCEVRIALLSPTAWHARQGIAADADADRVTRSLMQFEARQRQFAALLDAHAVPVLFVHCPADNLHEL
ncbi:MAG: hypothetical protein JWL98_1260 [Xanthomonadaceae bacterium]|nr:hypothetical protein [Xanthomonadaceae bacterium]